MRVIWKCLVDEESRVLLVCRVLEADDRCYRYWTCHHACCVSLQNDEWCNPLDLFLNMLVLCRHWICLLGLLSYRNMMCDGRRGACAFSVRPVSGLCWFSLTLQHMKTSWKVTWQYFLWNYWTIYVWYLHIERNVRRTLPIQDCKESHIETECREEFILLYPWQQVTKKDGTAHRTYRGETKYNRDNDLSVTTNSSTSEHKSDGHDQLSDCACEYTSA